MLLLFFLIRFLYCFTSSTTAKENYSLPDQESNKQVQVWLHNSLMMVHLAGE